MARRQKTDTEQPQFLGFDRPESNYFRLPNSWTDITAGITNIAELKVVEYILRHTWGYQEYDQKKHITMDEFVNGRRREDSTRMDRGTGLSERAVRYGLQAALQDGLIEEEVDNSDRGRVKKYYSLRMRGQGAADPAGTIGTDRQVLQSGVQTLHPPLQTLHPGRQSLPPRGATVAPRTEKDTLERQDISNIRKAETEKWDEHGEDDRFVEAPERSPDASASPAQPTPQPRPETPVVGDRGAEFGHRLEPSAAPATNGYRQFREQALRLREEAEQEQDAGRPRPSKTGRSPAAAIGRPGSPLPADVLLEGATDATEAGSGMTPIGAVLPQQRGRPPGSAEDRTRVAAYLAEWMPQWNDEAPLRSSVTRALNIFKQAKVQPELWGDCLYQARAKMRESQASITKQANSPHNRLLTKNLVPFFFACLEDVVGLRPESTPPPAGSEHAP